MNICSVSFLRCLITWVVISVYGYFTHFVSHKIDMREIFSKFDISVSENEYVKNISGILLDIYDFHDKIHHDTEINRRPINIFYEFAMNVYTQGVCLIVLVETIRLLDYKVIILWSFLYATVHNINYMYLQPSTHRDHHIDSFTNYGIDTLDIFFETKYDINDIEDFNHAAINLLIITCVILCFTNRT